MYFHFTIFPLKSSTEMAQKCQQSTAYAWLKGSSILLCFRFSILRHSKEIILRFSRSLALDAEFSGRLDLRVKSQFFANLERFILQAITFSCAYLHIIKSLPTGWTERYPINLRNIPKNQLYVHKKIFWNQRFELWPSELKERMKL